MQQWLFDIRSRKFVLLLISFLILTYLAYTKIILPLDSEIENYVHSIHGSTSLDLMTEVITEIGWVPHIAIFSIILFIKKSTRRLGLVLLLTVLLGSILSAYMKCYVGYEKPTLEFVGAHLPIPAAADLGVPCNVDGSFPAGYTVGTTTSAFVLGFALSRRFPRGCHLVWIYPAAVSVSRIYLLQQFTMDSVGGILLGLLIADIVSKKLKLELIFAKSKI